MHLAFPFTLDARGRTATNTVDGQAIKQLIEQVLFTAPGERVNRPTFGSGLLQLAFSPNSEELATATQFLVQAALQQWLGELIQVEAARVQSQENVLEVTVQYVVRRTQQRRVAQFSRTV